MLFEITIRLIIFVLKMFAKIFGLMPLALILIAGLISEISPEFNDWITVDFVILLAGIGFAMHMAYYLVRYGFMEIFKFYAGTYIIISFALYIMAGDTILGIDQYRYGALVVVYLVVLVYNHKRGVSILRERTRPALTNMIDDYATREKEYRRRLDWVDKETDMYKLMHGNMSDYRG